MLNQLKKIPKRTIIWFVLFCLFSVPLYALIIGAWVALPFPIHSFPSLAAVNMSGALVVAIILATALTLLTRQRSFLLGLCFGIVTIVQMVVLFGAGLEINSKIWWLYVGEYSTFILFCSLTTRYLGQVFHVKNANPALQRIDA